ncbi:hypothetical protein FALB51S_01304 [Frigidibacter albus]
MIRAASATGVSGAQDSGRRAISSAIFIVAMSAPRGSPPRLRLKNRSKAGDSASNLRNSAAGNIRRTLGSAVRAVVAASPSRISPRSPKLLRAVSSDTSPPLRSSTSTAPRLTRKSPSSGSPKA